MSGNALPRVLIIMPHLGDGGAERLTLDLLIELRRQGLQAEMLVMQRRGPRVEEAAERGVPIDYGRGAGQSLVLHGARILWKALRAARRSDVVVAGLDGPTTGLALLAARLTRRPCVAMVQNDMTWVRLSDQRPPSMRWLMRKVNLIARADLAITVSESAAGSAIREGVPPERIQVVQNGIDLERVLGLSAQPGPKDWSASVLCVSRLTPQKGLDVLIRAHAVAVEAYPHQLVIVGEGPEREALQNLVLAMGLEQTIEFWGFLANPYPVMANAGLFCLPSLFEGLPLVILEALLLAIPVISTDCQSGPRTALDGGRFGDLVVTEDVDALANAIVAHLEDPERLREKAAGGRRGCANASPSSARHGSTSPCSRKSLADEPRDSDGAGAAEPAAQPPVRCDVVTLVTDKTGASC